MARYVFASQENIDDTILIFNEQALALQALLIPSTLISEKRPTCTSEFRDPKRRTFTDR